MSLNSTVYEITLSNNGIEHVVESLCVETNEATLIKAIKSAISSLHTLGVNGPIKYCKHTERRLLPEFSNSNIRF